MKELGNTGRGQRAQALLQASANTTVSADSRLLGSRRAGARAYLGRHAWYAAVLVVVAVAATVLGGVLIGRDPESGPALFAVQFFLILCGPVGLIYALGWAWVMLLRRRSVRLRQWRAFPARSASLGHGTLTVVGIELAPGATWVIYPEQILRSRVRRLVEREGKLLVLMPRPGHLNLGFLYGGPDGHPVFADYSGMTEWGYWVRHGLAALDRASRGRDANDANASRTKPSVGE